MSVSYLPIELLQQIFSCLPFRDLLSVSLVCTRWNQASEKFITSIAKFTVTPSLPKNSAELNEVDERDRDRSLCIIRNSIRNYQTIEICLNAELKSWYQIQPTVAECVQKFPSIDELNLYSFRFYLLHWIYIAHRDWMMQCKSLNVSLQNCTSVERQRGQVDERKEFILKLPNLKRLSWRECEYDPHRKVTISVPSLETICLKGGRGGAPGEMNLQCNLIKHVVCEPLEENTFSGKYFTSLESIETLTLTVKNITSLKFLRKLHQLRELEISFSTDRLQELEDMCTGLRIRTLKVVFSVLKASSVDLQRLFQNIPTLEVLKLRYVDLHSERCISAQELKQLDLQGVQYCKQFTLDAPKLSNITADMKVLENMSLINATKLTKVRALLTSRTLKNTLEKIVPFLQTHENVTHLTVVNDHHRKEDDFLDKLSKNHWLLNLEKLELQWITLTIDFFRMIAEWKSLQSLTLISCTIDCKGLADSEWVQLPSVHRMVIMQDCKLKNTTRRDCPLLPRKFC